MAATAISIIRKDIEGPIGREFEKALPSHIAPEKFQRAALTAIQSSPGAMKAEPEIGT